MRLSPQLDELATDDAAKPAGMLSRCSMANFRWEHTVGDERADDYLSYLDDPANHQQWQTEHKDYLRENVWQPRDQPRTSACFTSLNQQAHLLESMDDTFLLRLESLDGLLNGALTAEPAKAFWQRFINRQSVFFKPGLALDDEGSLEAFINLWNAERTQARPLFATFLNHFGGNIKELVKQDWPHLMRDQLGLAHWPSTPGKDVPVALMCYKVSEVRAARQLAISKGAVASFTRPTVLDSEFNSAFVPGALPPGGESYGYTLDLSGQEIPEGFAPELLTFPLDYKPEHLKALGFISTPHILDTDDKMLDARNRHVQGLRSLAGCADFGEVLV